MNRKWLSVRILLGLFSLLWGGTALWGISNSFTKGILQGLNGNLAANQILGKGAFVGSLCLSVILFVWAILLMTSGIGILTNGNWSWRLYVILISIWFCLVPVRFFLFGTFVSRFTYDLLLIAPLVLFSLRTIYKPSAITTLGLSDDSFRKIRGDITGTIKVFTAFWFVYGFSVLAASVAWPYLFRTPQAIRYEMVESEPSIFVIKDRCLFDYAFRLPDRFHLLSANFGDQPDGLEDSAVLTDHQRRESIWIHRQSGYDLMKGIDPGKRSGYDFARRYIREKFGIIFLTLKRIQTSSSTHGRFDEVEVSNWRGVVYDSDQKDSQAVTSDFSLWDKRSGQPIDITFIGRAKKFDPETVKLVLSSLNCRFSQN